MRGIVGCSGEVCNHAGSPSRPVGECAAQTGVFNDITQNLTHLAPLARGYTSVALPSNSGLTAYCSLFYFYKAANYTQLGIPQISVPVKGNQVDSLSSTIPTGIPQCLSMSCLFRRSPVVLTADGSLDQSLVCVQAKSIDGPWRKQISLKTGKPVTDRFDMLRADEKNVRDRITAFEVYSQALVMHQRPLSALLSKRNTSGPVLPLFGELGNIVASKLPQPREPGPTRRPRRPISTGSERRRRRRRRLDPCRRRPSNVIVRDLA
jgi:hypothetical protein